MRHFAILTFLGILLFQSGCGLRTVTPPAIDSLAAMPHYSGTLTGATEWRGDVVMDADVRVPAGSRLTVYPGTRVYVRAAKGTKIDPEYLSSATELLVQGELVIAGTTDNQVVFMPIEVPVKEDYGWAGIELVGATNTRISGAILNHAETGILCIGSSPLITDNRLTGCRYGLIIQHQSSPKISDNLIEAGEGGIFCWRSSRPVLVNNRIVNHAEEGLYIDANSRPRLGQNVIRGNDIGLYVGSPEINHAEIKFSKNRIDVHRSYAIIASGGTP